MQWDQRNEEEVEGDWSRGICWHVGHVKLGNLLKTKLNRTKGRIEWERHRERERTGVRERRAIRAERAWENVCAMWKLAFCRWGGRKKKTSNAFNFHDNQKKKENEKTWQTRCHATNNNNNNTNTNNYYNNSCVKYLFFATKRTTFDRCVGWERNLPLLSLAQLIACGLFLLV